MRLLLALLLLAPAAARADSAPALGLDDLIDLSQEIVVGQVEGSESHFDGKLVVTVTTVRIDEALKGQPGERITVTQVGGTAVHPRLGVPVSMQASTFTALGSGEAVVLFVDRSRTGARRLVGAQQGKLVLRSEPGAPPAVAVGPKRLRAVPEAPRSTIGASGMTLDELRARVRSRLAKEARP